MKTKKKIIQEVSKAIDQYHHLARIGLVEEMESLQNLYREMGRNDEVLWKCVKGGHQHRLQKIYVEAAVEGLRSFDFHHSYDTFEELYDAVVNLLGSIERVKGRLTLYDITRRIGHILDQPVYPEAFVYLSRGAMDGARYVVQEYKGRRINFRMPIDDFADYFPNQTSMEIEDILCVYFHDAEKKKQQTRRNRCGNNKKTTC